MRGTRRPVSESDFEFTELVRRVRSNDRDAIEELLRCYEPLVRREIRARMIQSPMRRLVDSLDVSQSVWFNFFVRATAGDFELMTSDQLGALLLTMTRNKLASYVRKHNRARRSIARIEAIESIDQLSMQAETPVEVAEAQEVVDRFNQKLSDDERLIASLRRDGCSWSEVAHSLGGTAQGRRMQLSRAVERISIELGLEPT